MGVSRYYTYLSPSTSLWVGISLIYLLQCVSRWEFFFIYLYIHISFTESLVGGFSLYRPLLTLLSPSFRRWVGIFALYTYTSSSDAGWGFSLFIYIYNSFSESLGGRLSLYILTYLLNLVSRSVYLHISFSEPLGGVFSLYIFTYLLQ